MSRAIDVWDIGTFDPGLMALLRAEADLVRGYADTEQRIFLEYDHAPGGRASLLRPSNPWASRFQEFKETIGRAMTSRTIRAWHYARLTGAEIQAMRQTGIHLSTPETLRARIDALVSTGELTHEIAEAAYRKSPFFGGQLDIRRDRFWMTSHPIAVDDGLVDRLLAFWGGEVASFWNKDPEVLKVLGAIGSGCVVEIAVPLASAAQFDYAAGAAVIASYGRSLGCVTSKQAFDLYTTTTLPAQSVLAIHSENAPQFARIGRDFPPGFIDVDIRYWEELTGEKD